ncbi:MAG: phosphotransferase [Chitinophagaceae bacterium]|nr:phosphotransferase [Chitinophagaceae bacterium]
MTVDIEDIDNLIAYLRSMGKIDEGEECSVRHLAGGVSNKTELFTRANGEQWVIKQALGKLRVKEDWFCDEERILIEYKGLKWLSSVLAAGPVPQPVFFDEENHVLCMTAVPQPHENLKTLILKGAADEDFFVQLGHILGRMHRAGQGNEEAAAQFSERKFFKDLRIEPYYQFTAGRIPASGNFFQKLIDDTLAITETVVHGDYSPKNVLVRNNRVVLLDYEVMHYGDPAFDVGFFMCQMLSFLNHLADTRESLAQSAKSFWTAYVDKIGDVSPEAEYRGVRHTMGCLLARVKGRSPVDFLTPEEQDRQIETVLEFIESPVEQMIPFIETFKTKINAY